MLPGNANRVRVHPYHIVGDLRLEVEAVLPDAESSASLRLEKDGQDDAIEIRAAGVICNNSPVEGRPGVSPGEWFSAAFSRVDGELRLAINGADIALPQRETTALPSPDYKCASSGASFSAAAGGVSIKRLSLARDIHYFSDYGNPLLPGFSAAMSKDAELDIPENAFAVLGDNADSSADSRAWGALPLARLEGTIVRIERGEPPLFTDSTGNQ